MKTQSKWLIACASLCLVAAPASAAMEFGLWADEYDVNSLRANPGPEVGYTHVRSSQEFSNSRTLIGATVRDPQGNRLGTVHDVVLSPRNGETFAAIRVGFRTYALVPIQALTITPGTGILNRKAEVTLNSTKENLENGPTIRNGEWDQLDNPTFTQSVYTHYQMQPPTAVGGTGGGFGGTSSGTQQSPPPPQ
jgi:hypothetical protein